MTVQQYQSVTLHQRDVTDLESFAEAELGTTDLSYRAMIRVLLDHVGETA